MVLTFLFIFILGAIMGSFLGAWTYRLPRRLEISKGRSFCPKCKHEIAWYDNIPILSYLALDGKCRNCKAEIGLREPLIELSTGILFAVIFNQVSSCFISTQVTSSLVCDLTYVFGWWSLPYLLAVTFFLIAIFVTDFEHTIIPDEFSYTLLFLGILGAIGGNYNDFFMRLFISTLTSLFLLLLHGVTKGRGMGLGDVKLVLFAPLILGTWQNVVIWLMLSFIVGAVVGVIFILIGKASFGKQIPFGPFLIISFFITLLFSDILRSVLIF